MRVIAARYAGTARDGTVIHKGREILWDPRTRRVETACPERIAAWRAGQSPDPIDLAWEDSCARGAGVDSLSPFRD